MFTAELEFLLATSTCEILLRRALEADAFHLESRGTHLSIDISTQRHQELHDAQVAVDRG